MKSESNHVPDAPVNPTLKPLRVVFFIFGVFTAATILVFLGLPFILGHLPWQLLMIFSTMFLIWGVIALLHRKGCVADGVFFAVTTIASICAFFVGLVAYVWAFVVWQHSVHLDDSLFWIWICSLFGSVVLLSVLCSLDTQIEDHIAEEESRNWNSSVSLQEMYLSEIAQRRQKLEEAHQKVEEEISLC